MLSYLAKYGKIREEFIFMTPHPLYHHSIAIAASNAASGAASGSASDSASGSASGITELINSGHKIFTLPELDQKLSDFRNSKSYLP